METELNLQRVTMREHLVDAHFAGANARDLAAIMHTFGDAPRFEDEPWGERLLGRREVERHIRELLHAIPDLELEMKARHVASDAIIVEAVMRGTHQDTWHSIPATGLPIAVQACTIFTFDDRDKLGAERMYYDRATLLRQLGLFHDFTSITGRVMTPLTHPITAARAMGHRLFHH